MPPDGIDVATDGTVYVADTFNHRILRLRPGEPEEIIGQYGTRAGQLLHPRDVAVDPTGRLFVADTQNHRVTILNSDGTYQRTLGVSPLFVSPQKIVVDTQGRVFIVDLNAQVVVAYLGADQIAPFDPYLRDYVGDTGVEPSASGYVFLSGE